MIMILFSKNFQEQNEQQSSWNFEDQNKQGGQSSELETPTCESSDSNQGNTVMYEPESANYKWLDDGYKWRKCGNKQIKESKSPKSYYKCTYPGCPGRRTIGTSLNGHNITIVNTKEHNHPKPLNSRRSSSSLTYQNDENEIVSEVREAKVVIQMTSDIDVLDDGYKWRKYGQKVVKGNPNPRYISLFFYELFFFILVVNFPIIILIFD